MSERWLTLLNGLTRRLLEEPILLDDPHEVIEEFVVDGYQAKEVEMALAWIGRFIAEPTYGAVLSNETFTSTGFRTRSVEEQISFSPEAFGYLMRLENSGVIDASQREEILERALGSFEDEIGEEEIKLVSRLVLQDHGMTVDEEGSDPLALAEKSRGRHLH